MSSVFTINIEKPGITEIIGVYSTKEEAKKRAKEYKKEQKDITFKENKKETKEKITILYTDKEGSNMITLNEVQSNVYKEKEKPKKKKELSPYMIYAKENRERIVKEHPKASFVEIARITGKEWAELKKEKKKVS